LEDGYPQHISKCVRIRKVHRKNFHIIAEDGLNISQNVHVLIH